MILCIFEGEKRERRLFDTIRSLFFRDKIIEYSCVGGTFHALYKKLKSNEWDIVPILKQMERAKGENKLQKYSRYDFSEVYLFFDYDPQDNHNDSHKLNSELREMLMFFNEETTNGKMYISYPMIESLLYTKRLPDALFYSYVIEVSKCGHFKQEASSFSAYGNYDFLTGDNHYILDDVCKNWKYLILQNVAKANYICSGNNTLPLNKEDVSQQNIFQNQEEKYVKQNKSIISILGSFGMFLYDYFKWDEL